MQMVHLHTASAAWHPEKVGPQGAVNKWCWLRWRERASSLQLVLAVSLPVLSPMSYPQSRSGGGQRGKPCLSPESRAPREQRRVLWSCAQPSLTREVLFPHSLPQENTSTSWPLANAGNLGVETKRYSGSRGISPTPTSTCPEPSSSVSALPCQEGSGGVPWTLPEVHGSAPAHCFPASFTLLRKAWIAER